MESNPRFLRGKDDICGGSRQKWEDVPSLLFIEADLLRSKSVGGGKYELQYNEEKWKDMQQHLKEHCSLKLHLSTCRPREGRQDAGRFMFVLTGCVKKRRTTTRNSLDRRDRRCTRKEMPMKFCSLGARLS